MRTEQCNRVQVERYFLGEALGGEKSTIRTHMDGCPECRGHMATLENDKRAYLIAHPFREFAAKYLDEGGAESRRASATKWLPAFAGIAACLALVPMVMHYNGGAAPVREDGVRTKGGTVLEYYVKRGETITPGSTTEPYRTGDELQFVYATDVHPFVTLASIDVRGHVTLYNAEGGKSPSVAAEPGGKQSLPFAVTLDDSPGAEFFVMIYSPGPLAGEAVESWLMGAFTRASGNLEGVASLLAPPPGPLDSGAPDTIRGGSEIKTLLIRKTQA
ncbi:MAG: hypothetical protein ABIW76_18780 [Fibrobacteria bacterium]